MQDFEKTCSSAEFMKKVSDVLLLVLLLPDRIEQVRIHQSTIKVSALVNLYAIDIQRIQDS